MNSLLERLGSWAVRRHWVVIIGWLVILGGLVGARHEFGGGYVNNYSVSGSDSAAVLNSTYPQQGGYGGQIVFDAPGGSVAAQQSAVNQATANVAALPHVSKAVSPFASATSGAVSKDGSIAYASVSWLVNPDSLGTGYLDKLNKAVAPASKAGLLVDYGAGAGQIGQQTSDRSSEIIGLSCAPSVMTLLGSHAWWMPRWLEPVVPRLHLEEGATGAAAAAGHAKQASRPAA